MATINLVPDKTYYYDPDGANAPLTMLFPPIAGVDGQRIRFGNQTNSNTNVTLDAGTGQTLNNPLDLTTFAQTQVIGSGQLLYEYVSKGTQWRLVNLGDPDLAANALAAFAYAAYGGLYLDTAPVAGADIGAAWTTITAFDTIKYTTPKGVVQNLANNSLSFTLPGVYMMTLILSFEHVEAQAGRTTYLRLYNLTDTTPVGGGIPVFIARNQPGTTISLPFPLVITAAGINKEIQLQIGNGDSITGVSYEGLDWAFHSIGEYQGVI